MTAAIPVRPPIAGVRELVARATLSVSPHHRQPWRLIATRDGIELRPDRSQRLPHADPDDRELVIGCGAALLMLRVALAELGYGVRVDGGDADGDAEGRDTLAALHWTLDRPDDSLCLLGDVVGLPHVCRGALAPVPVQAEIVDRLVDACDREGAAFVQVWEADRRSAIADLVARGDREHFKDTSWREELAAWTRRPTAEEGLVRPDASGSLARQVVRRVDLGRSAARRDRDAVLTAPVLGVLTTPGDSTADRLAAGQALQRLALVAAHHGLSVGLSDQACQVPALRRALGALLDAGTPQLVVRVGRRPDRGALTVGRGRLRCLVP